MRISDWSSDVCSSDLMPAGFGPGKGKDFETGNIIGPCIVTADAFDPYDAGMIVRVNGEEVSRGSSATMQWKFERSEEHTSELQSLMRLSYDVFCLKKKNKQKQ